MGHFSWFRIKFFLRGCRFIGERIGVRMAMLAWMVWGVVLMLGFYAVFVGNQQVPESSKENWSPQALDGFYNERKGFRDAGFIVILCCLLVLLLRIVRS
jgi:hypothetical protein